MLRRLGRFTRSGRVSDTDGRRFIRLGLVLARLVLLVVIVLEVAEDVIQDVKAIRLLRQEKGLGKLAPLAALVRHLAQHLDHDAAVGRRLAVDIRHVHLGIFEADRIHPLVDRLLAHTGRDVFVFSAMHHRAFLRVEAVETRRVLVHERIVLGHKEPSHF